MAECNKYCICHVCIFWEIMNKKVELVTCVSVQMSFSSLEIVYILAIFTYLSVLDTQISARFSLLCVFWEGRWWGFVCVWGEDVWLCEGYGCDKCGKKHHEEWLLQLSGLASHVSRCVVYLMNNTNRWN